MTRLFAGTQWDRPPRCDTCGALEEDCQCPPPPPKYAPPGAQTAHVQLERRRAGKRVTVIRGLAAADNDLTDLIAKLRARCGAGGTVKDDLLEIQGDQTTKVTELLSELGYKTKAPM